MRFSQHTIDLIRKLNQQGGEILKVPEGTFEPNAPPLDTIEVTGGYTDTYYAGKIVRDIGGTWTDFDTVLVKVANEGTPLEIGARYLGVSAAPGVYVVDNACCPIPEVKGTVDTLINGYTNCVACSECFIMKVTGTLASTSGFDDPTYCGSCNQFLGEHHIEGCGIGFGIHKARCDYSLYYTSDPDFCGDQIVTELYHPSISADFNPPYITGIPYPCWILWTWHDSACGSHGIENVWISSADLCDGNYHTMQKYWTGYSECDYTNAIVKVKAVDCCCKGSPIPNCWTVGIGSGVTDNIFPSSITCGCTAMNNTSVILHNDSNCHWESEWQTMACIGGIGPYRSRWVFNASEDLRIGGFIRYFTLEWHWELISHPDSAGYAQWQYVFDADAVYHCDTPLVMTPTFDTSFLCSFGSTPITLTPGGCPSFASASPPSINLAQQMANLVALRG